MYEYNSTMQSAPLEGIPSFDNSSTSQSLPYFRNMPKFGEPGFEYHGSFGFPVAVDIGPLINQMNLTYCEKFPEEISKKSERIQNKIKSGKILRDKCVFGSNLKWNDDERKKVKEFDKFHNNLIKHIISHTKYQPGE